MPEGTFNLDGNQGNQPHQITPEELAAGTEAAPAQTPPVVATPIIAATPAQATTPPPVAAPPVAMPPTPGASAAQAPASGTTPPTPEQPKGEGNAKKYIIIAIVVIVLLTGAYFAYSFFMNDSGESEENDAKTTEESSAKNKLGNDSDKTEIEDTKEKDDKKLEELTEELESTFGDETAGEEEASGYDAPPSLSIGVSESTESETEPAEIEAGETPEVIDETVMTPESSDTAEGSEPTETPDDEKIFR